MSLHSLPLFVRMAGRPVILLGEGEAADAKRRLLERAGAMVVGEEADAALAIVAIDDEVAATAAVARLKARGLLVNAVDRSALCDFTLPAIVDRNPVLIAIGTGGVSAGLAAALRQRLEALLPQRLGRLATGLFNRRARLRQIVPDGKERRRQLAAAFEAGGALDPLVPHGADGVEGYDEQLDAWLGKPFQPKAGLVGRFLFDSLDPDQMTVWQARVLANADRVFHHPNVPATILDRARADAVRIMGPMPEHDGQAADVKVYLEMTNSAAIGRKGA